MRGSGGFVRDVAALVGELDGRVGELGQVLASEAVRREVSGVKGGREGGGRAYQMMEGVRVEVMAV